jgi:hypothetical protein
MSELVFFSQGTCKSMLWNRRLNCSNGLTRASHLAPRAYPLGSFGSSLATGGGRSKRTAPNPATLESKINNDAPTLGAGPPEAPWVQGVVATLPG